MKADEALPILFTSDHLPCKTESHALTCNKLAFLFHSAATFILIFANMNSQLLSKLNLELYALALTKAFSQSSGNETFARTSR
jgi:hypothetical protein